jgi:hypothetical protein
MKTESSLQPCPQCGMRFDQQHSSVVCPHRSLTYYGKLEQMKRDGPPYRLDPDRFKDRKDGYSSEIEVQF